jgi:hypothetical protein
VRQLRRKMEATRRETGPLGRSLRSRRGLRHPPQMKAAPRCCRPGGTRRRGQVKRECGLRSPPRAAVAGPRASSRRRPRPDLERRDDRAPARPHSPRGGRAGPPGWRGRGCGARPRGSRRRHRGRGPARAPAPRRSSPPLPRPFASKRRSDRRLPHRRARRALRSEWGRPRRPWGAAGRGLGPDGGGPKSSRVGPAGSRRSPGG